MHESLANYSNSDEYSASGLNSTNNKEADFYSQSRRGTQQAYYADPNFARSQAFPADGGSM